MFNESVTFKSERKQNFIEDRLEINIFIEWHGHSFGKNSECQTPILCYKNKSQAMFLLVFSMLKR